MAWEELGTLRSWVQRASWTEEERASAWSLMRALQEEHSERYQAEVVPYLAGFAHHFKEPWGTCESEEELLAYLALAPFAAVRLHLSHATSPSVYEVIPEGTYVTHLGLKRGAWGAPHHDAMFSSPKLDHMHSLRLDQCTLGDAGAAALARARLEGLRHLGLIFQRPSVDAMEVLTSSDTLANLTSFCWRDRRLPEEVTRAFVTSERFGALETLYLSGLKMGEKTTIDFARAGFHGLRSLTLGLCRIGVRGAQALAESPMLGRLESLQILNADITCMGMEEFAASEHLRRLRKLSFRTCRVEARGARALAASEAFPELVHLDLAGNRLGDEGIRVLAASPVLASVEELVLTSVRVGGEALRALLASPHLGRLRVLTLDVCALDDEDARSIAASSLALDALHAWKNPWGEASQELLRGWAEERGVELVL